MKKKENQTPKQPVRIDFRNLFNNNTFVLIFSIVVAIIVWFSIYVDQRPNSNAFITEVPITVNYENSMAKDLGLEIIGDMQYTTDVQVNGKKYKITRLDAEDFLAQVSLANVTEPGEYTLPVQVIRKESDPEYSIISWTTTEVKLKFDKVITKQYPIEIIAPGLTAADGYIMEKAYADIEALTVKGAEAVVNKIVRCVIEITNTEKLKESMNVSANAVFLDEEGNKVDDTQLIIDKDVISVTIPIYKLKTLPLQVEFVNIPKGFPIDKLKFTISKQTIEIASPSETIDSLEAIMVGPIDFRDIDIGSEIVVPIELKAGIKNVEELAEVSVKFPSYGYSSKNLELTNFVLENVPTGYEAKLVTERLRDVKIVGSSSVLNNLTSEDLVAIVDISPYAEKSGRYQAVAKIYCQGSVVAWAVGDYSVNVDVRKKQ